jgi:hypothetical protein
VGAVRIGRLVCAHMSAAGKQCCCSAETSCNSNTIYAFLSHTSLQIRTPLSCEQRPSAARPTSSASSGFGSGCKKKTYKKKHTCTFTRQPPVPSAATFIHSCTYKDTYNIQTYNIHTYKYIDTHATYTHTHTRVCECACACVCVCVCVFGEDASLSAKDHRRIVLIAFSLLYVACCRHTDILNRHTTILPSTTACCRQTNCTKN